MPVSLQPAKNIYHLIRALIAAAAAGYPAKKLRVIAVTGTDGKTTTSTLVYKMLQASSYKVALVSTVAAYIGDETIDTGFHVTSPDPDALQHLLKLVVDRGYTHLVLEATSHGLDQYRLFGTNITTAVVTNVTNEHLDYHRTYQNYLAAKAKIFRTATTAIINHDDHSYTALKKYIKPSSRWIAYSQQYENTRNFPFTQEEYEAITKAAKIRFSEKYNWSNTLAAATAAFVAGIPIDQIVTAITGFPDIPGRMQRVGTANGVEVIVDFAHTPNALKEALTAAKKNTKGKLIAVFGAAGARDAVKRPQMGKIAAELADEVVLTSEDPRHEDPRVIISNIKSGVTQNHGHVHGIVDRREAIAFALSLARKDDTVIICGKGHEQSMNLDGINEIPWSDVDVAKEEMGKRG